MDARISSWTGLIALASVALVSDFGATERAGLARDTLEDSGAAIRKLERAYERSNHDPEILLSLTRALARSGDVAEAVRYVDEAAGHQEWNSRLDMDLGLIFLNGRQCDAAQRRFRAA